MDQTSIATIFRKAELQNRVRRLHALIKNAEMLQHEPLTVADKIATANAIKSIHEMELHYERMFRPSYWKRLWRALLNH